MQLSLIHISERQRQRDVDDASHDKCSVPYTTLEHDAERGSKRLYVKDDSGFQRGDWIYIGSGECDDIARIVDFGSIILDRPLNNTHRAGATLIWIGHTSDGESLQIPAGGADVATQGVAPVEHASQSQGTIVPATIHSGPPAQETTEDVGGGQERRSATPSPPRPVDGVPGATTASDAAAQGVLQEGIAILTAHVPLPDGIEQLVSKQLDAVYPVSYTHLTLPTIE